VYKGNWTAITFIDTIRVCEEYECDKGYATDKFNV